MGVERESGLPLWRQVHGILLKEIKGGVYRPGESLPSESSLSRRFRVARHTIRRALKSLQDEGVVCTKRGRGSVIQDETKTAVRSLRSQPGQRPAVHHHRNGQNHFLHGGVVPATGVVAARLRIPPFAPVIHIEACGESLGKRLYINSQYFPAEDMAGIMEAYQETRSMAQSYQKIGVHECIRLESRISTCGADAEEARELGLSPGYPMLVIEYVNVDTDGRPIEYGRTRFAGDRIELLVPGEVEKSLA
ncbi:phosphonate metabolism transcriptional regulator PhnF [Oceanidesulfovibrio marinus]|uniref:Phosphonate metabolism transcriptional regulator PhnF n=1 Tax=Oceanidesulfovibrio marinus TaxID=370038 RepID=A0ABX6NKG7_9BACT|nr:phosphonate metabolism transcriptional regulator PhnF [Oceanidesulfovibrio marinus]QJT11162.1 phosphonate metabolism transcriptional regulator PhnF [Oceanidesulfovibrio marinus]